MSKAETDAPEFLEATESFSTELDGVPVVVSRGESVAAGHELVRRYPGFFQPLSRRSRFATVETATAAPGEKRNVGRRAPTDNG